MGYGLAVDIGTTNIKMEKVCLETGKTLGEYQTKNSQGKYGADVISRIQNACNGKAQELECLVNEDILNGMAKLQAREPERIAVACNTTMMALFCGDSLEGMLEYPFQPERLVVPENGRICIAPAAGAFLGGDVVAGLSVLPKKPEDFLFIDLGTNGELVLCAENMLLGASAAAGPAFEYMVEASGSMLLEALTDACKEGIVDETGLLAEQWFSTGYLWHSEEKQQELLLTQQKIREVQLAKAAIRTGVDFLCDEYRRLTGKLPEPQIVYLAGGMGVVQEEACLAIGMLPQNVQGRCRFLGNTALLGARQLLLQSEKLEEMQQLALKLQVYNLAEWSGFNEQFIKNINLK